jgi:LysM repeat protein
VFATFPFSVVATRPSLAVAAGIRSLLAATMRFPTPFAFPKLCAGLLLAVLTASTGLTAEGAPVLEFAGVMKNGDRTLVALLDKSTGTTSPWLSPGGVFAGYTFKAFDSTQQTVVLVKDGAELRLPLVAARVRPGEANGKLSPKTALSIYHNVRQIAAAADQYYLENAKLAATLEDIVGPNKNMKRLVHVSGEDYSTITLKQGTPVVLTTAGGDVIPAQASADVKATYAFHPVRAGDTGAKIAGVMNMTISELMALNPDVNWNQLSTGQILRVK